MTFSEKLVELRQAAGMTQPALAEAAGIPLSTLRNYEQARTVGRINFATAITLAKALGVSCEAFASCSDLTPDEPTPRVISKRK